MAKGGLGSRLLVAAWGIPLLLGLTLLGGWWTALLVAVIALLAQIEYYRLHGALGRRPLKIIGVILGVFIVAAWSIGGNAIVWVVVTAFLVILMCGMLLERSHADVLATFGGVCYPPLMMGTFLLVRGWEGAISSSHDDGQWLALCMWGAIWIGDTAAYLGGRMFGKNPLAPRISPKKTTEGFMFGLFGSVVFCLVWWRAGLTYLDTALVVGLAAGLFGQMGDLAESTVKREASVKDSSGFLPGHGGILDRFDSFMTTAPVVAMYLLIRDRIM